MNRVLAILLAGTFAASLSACNKAEDPSKTKADVAEAQAERQKEVAQARGEANRDAMENQKNVAMEKAEGDHKVAIERCEALPGDQQKACKEQADANYESAKAGVDLPGPS